MVTARVISIHTKDTPEVVPKSHLTHFREGPCGYITSQEYLSNIYIYINTIKVCIFSNETITFFNSHNIRSNS